MDYFTKAQKRDLSAFFGLPRRIGAVKIAKLTEEQGFDDAREFINFWVDRLTDRKKEIKRERNREKRRLRQEKERLKNLAVPINSILDVVNEARQDKPLTPFQLTLRSGVSPDMVKTFQYKNKYHANNSIARLLEAVGEVKEFTDSTGEFHEVMMSNVWSNVIVEIADLAGGASNDRNERRTFIGDYNKYTVRQVRIRNNNCALDCLKYALNLHEDATSLYHSMRVFVKSQPNTLITIQQFEALFNKYAPQNSKLIIHSINSDIDFVTDATNILLHNNHYYVILSIEKREFETSNKVKHGSLFWDIETRPTSKFCTIKRENGDVIKSYYLKETILTAVYLDNKATEWKTLYFKSDAETSLNTCCRKFLDWLKQQGRDKKYYYCRAHNGGNFDLYFLLKNFNEDEKANYIPTLRGTTIIKLEFGNNIFLDTYCFLTASLSTLSNGFKVSQGKLKEFHINGITITSEQLCFYKPNLSFDEFLSLEDNEPEYWRLYVEYCQVDTLALREIWGKFNNAVDMLINKYVEAAPYRKVMLKIHCLLNQSCTIAGHAQKILNILNGVSNGKKNDFMGKVNTAYKLMTQFIDTEEKHNFIMNNFKRGGISHCNQKGKHNEGVMCVDICSQYPSSAVHMEIPGGESEFIEHYDDAKHGFYILENLKFDYDNYPYKFKPVYEVGDNGVLNWNTTHYVKRTCLNSLTIRYLQKYYGLISFDVVKGLVSNKLIKGHELFGLYNKVLFDEKARQDELKKNDDPEYNNALRETVKLYLNSITGKLVMNKARYDSFNKVVVGGEENATKNIDGVKFELKEKTYNPNMWLVSGVCIYDYSKILLFEYIRNLPNNSNDIIHTETDSLYFPLRCKEQFIKNIENYDGLYPVKFGDQLGNIKIEIEDNTTSYFLNKKVYTIFDSSKGKQKYVWKGIPSSTILDDGKRIPILTYDKYEAVYNHKESDPVIVIEYATLCRQLFGETRITAHRQTRTMNSTHDYKEYQ